MWGEEESEGGEGGEKKREPSSLYTKCEISLESAD